MRLSDDRLFNADPGQRAIARRLYAEVRGLPIVSPHGHTDPAWFAGDAPFGDPVELLVTPDHYVFRMLYSAGVRLEDLGIARLDGGPVEKDSRKIWRTFAAHFHLFRGTPTSVWWDHVLAEVFAIDERLTPATADAVYERIAASLATPAFRPRALFERFKIETLATTDSPTEALEAHEAIAASGWKGRVIPTFRPDPVVDAEHEGFHLALADLGELTGEDTQSYGGYLRALARRRWDFKALGATATDHGHPTARTAAIPPSEARKLFDKAVAGTVSPDEAELFRAHMLTEMARMSLDDGLVMQLHPGAFRNHNPTVRAAFGRDKGADLPVRTEYVHSLKPLLDLYGNDPRLSLILFTLDESSYSRELAPLAGHYPAVKLGPAWWFHDSPEGMKRYRRAVTETAGFYNTVGFNDDTRAFLSIPARHDLARRVDCAFLAELVSEHRLAEDEARELAVDLTYNLVRKAYKL